MEAGRGRRRAREEDGDNHHDDVQTLVDRISELPNELAHHILSFLPTEDVARTSALSRRWTSIWRTLPSVDFDESRFRRLGYNFLLCRLYFLFSLCRFFFGGDGYPILQKIRIFLINPLDSFVHGFLDLYIGFSLLRSRFLELDITIDDDHSSSYEDSSRLVYIVPEGVFNSARYLTSLMLKACSCPPCEGVNMPSLKNLSLTYVLIADQMLQELITQSPNLEDLNIEHCFNMVALRVFNANLRRLIVASRRNLMLLEMDAPSLCFFQYHGLPPMNHHPDADAEDVIFQSTRLFQFVSPNRSTRYESLKAMILSHVNIADPTLRAMLVCFQFLESAKFHCCTFGIVPLNVNPRLELLEIENTQYERLLFNAENLHRFAVLNPSVHTHLNRLASEQFDNLKAMTLVGNIYFGVSGKLRLTSAPCLETLIVRSCFLLKGIILHSDSLKSLTMDSNFNLEDCKIIAPNLEFFSYEGLVMEFSELDLSDDVVIELKLRKQAHMNVLQDLYEIMVWNFLALFEYNRYISIESDEPETMLAPRRLGLDPPIRFIEEFKVTTVLTGMTCVNFLLEVINQAFCFKALVVNMGLLTLLLKFDVPPNMAQLANEGDEVMIERHNCVKCHLIEAEVVNFEGNIFDLEMVGYVLGNARFLNILTIGFRGQLPPNVISAATVTIISFRRANPFVTIAFKYNY